MQIIHLLAGLPRSGSTLLAALLSQNPAIHASNTSVLLPVLRSVDACYNLSAHAKAAMVVGQRLAILKAAASAAYLGVSKPVIVDKNRMWAHPENITLFTEILGHRPKVICTVRSIPEVLASFIRLFRDTNPQNSLIVREMQRRNFPMSDEGLCKYLMSEHGNVWQAWEAMRLSNEQGSTDCLHFVEYDDLVNAPHETLDKVYDFLGLSHYKHNVAEIAPLVSEDDVVYGIPGLHKVRPRLEKRSSDPAQLLGKKLYQFYSGGTFWRGPDPARQPQILDLQLAAFEHGDFELAESYCALHDPDDDRAAFNRGWYALRRGKVQEGMRLLERGRSEGVFGSPAPTSRPLWDGEELDGKTIILALEGGLGDQICNARFAKDIANRGGRVVLSGSPELAEVLLTINGVSAHVGTAAVPFTHHDLWYPSSSVLIPLGYEYPQLDGRPFIRWPTPHRTDKQLRIGIRWAGLKDFIYENKRRLDPKVLCDLDALSPNIKLISLQRDDPVQPSANVETPNLSTWAATANAIANCDLVISSCTSTAHLAAAMGKPTWIAVTRANEYFLWAMPGDQSPWYDSVRLFRQATYNDWFDTYAEIRAAIQLLIANQKQRAA